MPRANRTPTGLDLQIPAQGVAPGRSCGPLRRLRPALTAGDLEGGILLAQRARPSDLELILAAAGTLTLGGALLSHVSLLAREFGKPALALLPQQRARLLSPEGPETLELSEVPGCPGPVLRLQEGDVVLIDGERGLLRIPGGDDRAAHLRIRRMHEALASYARRPDDPERLDDLLRLARGFELFMLSTLIEAALLCRVVPAGKPARRLLRALMTTPRSGAVLSILGEIESWLIDQVDRRCRRASAALERIESPDELNRRRATLLRLVERDRQLLLDIGAVDTRVVQAGEKMTRRFDRRRQILRAEVEAQLESAMSLSPAELADEHPRLDRLGRRAREAGADPARTERFEARLAETRKREAARLDRLLVIPLDHRGGAVRELVGGKAYGLMRHGPDLPESCRVPRGFVVAASAYRTHLRGEVEERIEQAIEQGETEESVSRLARAAILKRPVPGEVAAAVEAAQRELAAERLAVRSSATGEDGAETSFAGLFDTYLGVRGVEELLDRIRASWASLWNPQALPLLGGSGASPLSAGMAVLVHELITTRSGGVMFTRDPGGRADTLLVNSAWGLGEAISRGEVAGDLFWVQRGSGETVAARWGNATRQIVLDPERAGALAVDLPPDLRGRPSLDSRQLARLAGLARRIDRSESRGMNVEFGFDDADDLLLLQVRPAPSGALPSRRFAGDGAA